MKNTKHKLIKYIIALALAGTFIVMKTSCNELEHPPASEGIDYSAFS